MDSTRIIRVYIPDNKVVQLQMFRGDWLYSLPDHLLSNYPEAFVGWIDHEFGFYHRTAGWLSMELKVGDLSAELELKVVRRDLALERDISQQSFPFAYAATHINVWQEREATK